MAKLTRDEIKVKADEWAKLQGKIETAENARNLELHPLQVAHEKKTAPIIEKWAEKIGPLETKADALHAEIIGWLNEQKKSVTVEGAKAIAELFKGTKPGKGRVADVKKFLAFVKTKGEEAVYGCLTVMLNKAEPLIGKSELDKICDTPLKDVAEATLVLKRSK